MVGSAGSVSALPGTKTTACASADSADAQSASIIAISMLLNSASIVCACSPPTDPASPSASASLGAAAATSLGMPTPFSEASARAEPISSNGLMPSLESSSSIGLPAVTIVFSVGVATVSAGGTCAQQRAAHAQQTRARTSSALSAAHTARAGHAPLQPARAASEAVGQ